MWRSETSVLQLLTYQGARRSAERKRSTTAATNAYARYVSVPRGLAFTQNSACVLVAMQNLLRLSQVHRPFPARRINDVCTDGTGMYSFRHAMEVLMEYARTAANLSWVSTFRYFRVVAGDRAIATMKVLHRRNLPFCFTYRAHAYCATNGAALTPAGRADRSHIYAFNALSKKSTTSRFHMSTLVGEYQSSLRPDMLYIADVEPPLDVGGTYMWNEHGRLYDASE
jgi:hypothetical protein